MSNKRVFKRPLDVYLPGDSYSTLFQKGEEVPANIPAATLRSWENQGIILPLASAAAIPAPTTEADIDEVGGQVVDSIPIQLERPRITTPSGEPTQQQQQEAAKPAASGPAKERPTRPGPKTAPNKAAVTQQAAEPAAPVAGQAPTPTDTVTSTQTSPGGDIGALNTAEGVTSATPAPDAPQA